MQFTIGDRMWIIPQNKFTENAATKTYKYVTGEGNNKKMLTISKAVHDQIQEAFRRRVENATYYDASKSI